MRKHGFYDGTYDVRWHIDIVGMPSNPTNTYLLTVAARMKNRGQANLFFSSPVTLRVMAGN